eukprot:9271667-Ditylum_brightwellii.AAC.1
MGSVGGWKLVGEGGIFLLHDVPLGGKLAVVNMIPSDVALLVYELAIWSPVHKGVIVYYGVKVGVCDTPNGEKILWEAAQQTDGIRGGSKWRSICREAVEIDHYWGSNSSVDAAGNVAGDGLAANEEVVTYFCVIPVHSADLDEVVAKVEC